MWLYQGKSFTSEDIGEYKAFVYQITNLTNNKKYIGKKRLTSRRTKPPLKGKVRKRTITKESDWQNYWGSNKELQEDVKVLGGDKFKREILRLCRTLSESSYYEAKEIFDKSALLTEDYYNGWIMIRVTSKHLTNLT